MPEWIRDGPSIPMKAQQGHAVDFPTVLLRLPNAKIIKQGDFVSLCQALGNPGNRVRDEELHDWRARPKLHRAFLPFAFCFDAVHFGGDATAGICGVSDSGRDRA